MSKLGKIFLAIMLIDLLTTVYVVQAGYANEANPILNWILVKYGLVIFTAVKVVWSVSGVMVLEYVGQFIAAARIRFYYTVAIISYLSLYIVLALKVNS